MAMLDVAPNTSTPEGREEDLLKACYPPKEAGAECRIHIRCPLLPHGVEPLKVHRAHTAILGGILLPSVTRLNTREPLQQRETHIFPDGEIQGQSNARRRKRHHSGRYCIPKNLNHGKE